MLDWTIVPCISFHGNIEIQFMRTMQFPIVYTIEIINNTFPIFRFDALSPRMSYQWEIPKNEYI